MRGAAALAALFCVLSVASARAETAFLTLPTPPDLVQWLHAQGWPAFRTVPQLQIVENEAAILNHDEGAINFASLAAESDGKVYLSAKAAVHLQEERYRALVVHELVHVAQQASGRRYMCVGQREAEAYQMQNLFLIEQGLPPAVEDDIVQQLKNCAAPTIAHVDTVALRE